MFFSASNGCCIQHVLSPWPKISARNAIGFGNMCIRKRPTIWFIWKLGCQRDGMCDAKGAKEKPCEICVVRFYSCAIVLFCFRQNRKAARRMVAYSEQCGRRHSIILHTRSFDVFGMRPFRMGIKNSVHIFEWVSSWFMKIECESLLYLYLSPHHAALLRICYYCMMYVHLLASASFGLNFKICCY